MDSHILYIVTAKFSGINFKCKNTNYIVFKNKILNYEIGNEKEKAAVCTECLKLGIPDNQCDFLPEDFANRNYT